MKNIDWNQLIFEAYQFGSEFGILGDLDLDLFKRDFKIEEVEAKSKEARDKYPKVLEFYKQKYASEDFVKYFQRCIENYEPYALGEYLIEIALKNNLAFEVDWKCDAYDFIQSAKKVFPELPDAVINDHTKFEFPYELADLINRNYLQPNADKLLIWYRILGDSLGFLLIPKSKIDFLDQNKFIEFITL